MGMDKRLSGKQTGEIASGAVRQSNEAKHKSMVPNIRQDGCGRTGPKVGNVGGIAAYFPLETVKEVQ